MHIKITWPYIAAFFALNLIMGELHEQAHIITGYVICGCYGARDFNVWSTCEQCSYPSWAFLATVAGPLFSCSLMWLGAMLFCKSSNTLSRSFGFSLLFANLPFARIFTALTGGGDEKVVIRFLIGDQSPLILAWIIAALLTLIICLPPVMMVFKRISNTNRIWIIIGFLVIPLIYGMFYQHLFLNLLLRNGVGAKVNFAGTPDLILAHSVLLLTVLILLRKKLLYSFINQTN